MQEGCVARPSGSNRFLATVIGVEEGKRQQDGCGMRVVGVQEAQGEGCVAHPSGGNRCSGR